MLLYTESQLRKSEVLMEVEYNGAQGMQPYMQQTTL